MIDPECNYLARQAKPHNATTVNKFHDIEEAKKTEATIPQANVWRGAEWYHFIRLLTLPLISTWFGGIRQSKLANNQGKMNEEFGIRDFATIQDTNIKELQIIEIMQIRKMLKRKPELIGTVAPDWIAIINDLAKLVKNAVPGQDLMYKGNVYVRLIGSDIMTMRVMMALTHCAITGEDKSEKYLRHLVWTIFYRDQEDRFGKNHQSQELKSIQQLCEVQLMQLPREPICGMTLDYRTFTDGKKEFIQYALPDNMKWPPRWVFEKYDTEKKFIDQWDGPKEIPAGYKMKIT